MMLQGENMLPMNAPLSTSVHSLLVHLCSQYIKRYLQTIRKLKHPTWRFEPTAQQTIALLALCKKQPHKTSTGQMPHLLQP